MNKRIQELADEAELYTVSDNSSMLFDVWKKRYTEKFAELIVKEMCDMMRQYQDDCDTGDASETNWGYIGQLQDWIDRFEKHFGVEE